VLTVELLTVVVLLGGVVGLYFTGLAITDSAFRTSHFERLLEEVSLLVAARAVYAAAWSGDRGPAAGRGRRRPRATALCPWTHARSFSPRRRLMMPQLGLLGLAGRRRMFSLRRGRAVYLSIRRHYTGMASATIPVRGEPPSAIGGQPRSVDRRPAGP
jgi:hypothetical protein